MERKGGNNREIRNDNGSVSKKEVDIDTLACEELVSKTLKLPLLSNSYSAVDKVKNKGIARNKGVHDVAMEESVEPICTQKIGWENPRAGSAQKVLEERKTSGLEDNSGYVRKDGYNKAEKTYDSVKAESNTLKGSEALNGEPVDPTGQKISQRGTLPEQENMKLTTAKEHTTSGGKRKSKGSQGHGSLAAEVPKESLRVGSSSMLKNKQTAHVANYTNKRDSGDQKLERPFRKDEDRYRDFFGDMGESKQEENQTCSLEIHSEDWLKEADKIEKDISAIKSAHNDRLTDKRTEDLSSTESHPRATVDGAPNSANANVDGTSLATAATVLVTDNWVHCDKCKKWRLLPVSINPADLPKKWSCSMLNWLPAMNRCSVDEDETTRAVFALYQVPAVESQTNLQGNPGCIISRLSSADALQPDQNEQIFGSHAIPPSGRKKHGLKEISNAMDKDGPTTIKKNMQSSVQSGSLTDVTRSPVVSEPALQHPSRCDLPVEKHKNKQKEKHKVLEHGSDGGNPRRCSDGEDNGGSDRSGKVRKEKTSVAAQDGSILDVQDKDGGQLGGSRARPPIESSPDIRKGQFMNGSVDYLGQEAQYAGKSTTMDEKLDEENQNDKHGNTNVTQPRKLGKGSSWSKDWSRNLKSDSVDEWQDCVPSYEVKPRDGRNKFQERLRVNSDEGENRLLDNKESVGKLSGESSKRESQSNIGCPDAKPDATGGQDVMSTVKQNIVQDGYGEKYTKRFHSDKSDHAEVASGRGNSLSLPHSGETQKELLTRCPRPVSGFQKGNGADGSQGDDALKVQKQIKKADHQNGTQHSSSRHTASGGQRIRDVNARSPMRKDSSSQAATNALKEAKHLKHLADRVKNSGSNVESTALYFQAALKFLHSASLLESCNNESTKHGEMIQSVQMYSSTAKLCEFCAHEYERLKDMAAASLAYKCTEVAYMRVIYTSHANASRDRHELQTALQMVPPGESPPSSASDVDNLNHPTTADKVALSKGVSSSQVAGNHVISTRNRPNFVRLLNFAQDVNYAMEASRKSRSAFANANLSLGGAEGGEVIYSVKKALDFNFQDVEGLLRLVREAMEAISH
ncbi:uncharacterized protein LOC111283908 isoform X4 [Durio zibethinus]|uniref:Uncharacterized protein LOC111283908 isoform X4 n=1 Tax=Durio zibethinus TaxID=66656 RepID=A0A6P5XJD9_DURZI|nr:uncharacterized protein LOC111283908 isoform X4 [Durio zibethinus]